MKTFVALLTSFAVFAAVAQPEKEETVPPPSMTQMQSRMNEMHALMERAQNAQDPAEKQRLMAEHMRLMHEGMTMMGPMMGSGGQAGERPCADNDMQCRMQRMQMQQGMMSQRMG